MRPVHRIAFVLLTLVMAAGIAAQRKPGEYPLGPDSLPQAGVPRGQLIGLVPFGDLYPTLIRKTPIKPIRIFLQDGSGDLDNVYGNWFLANQQVLAALEFANRTADAKQDPGPRYQVRHAWGDGAHKED